MRERSLNRSHITSQRAGLCSDFSIAFHLNYTANFNLTCFIWSSLPPWLSLRSSFALPAAWTRATPLPTLRLRLAFRSLSPSGRSVAPTSSSSFLAVCRRFEFRGAWGELLRRVFLARPPKTSGRLRHRPPQVVLPCSPSQPQYPPGAHTFRTPSARPTPVRPPPTRRQQSPSDYTRTQPIAKSIIVGRPSLLSFFFTIFLPTRRSYPKLTAKKKCYKKKAPTTSKVKDIATHHFMCCILKF